MGRKRNSSYLINIIDQFYHFFCLHGSVRMLLDISQRWIVFLSLLMKLIIIIRAGGAVSTGRKSSQLIQWFFSTFASPLNAVFFLSLASSSLAAKYKSATYLKLRFTVKHQMCARDERTKRRRKKKWIDAPNDVGFVDYYFIYLYINIFIYIE